MAVLVPTAILTAALAGIPMVAGAVTGLNLGIGKDSLLILSLIIIFFLLATLSNGKKK